MGPTRSVATRDGGSRKTTHGRRKGARPTTLPGTISRDDFLQAIGGFEFYEMLGAEKRQLMRLSKVLEVPKRFYLDV